ncbi:MAG: 7-cyano-7-deazaguanine synthase QueC [Methanosarcina sp.]|uniref:7-cyano-7-deazaguanine synthase QueC n=1 Tax=Methanosarcina sp. TaxID=2213 RepID=UPI0026032BD5|nr:7-cyano-7-deazaguanine synthase QueC [Methanosarcina sp.]MDD3248213.1 7-cyano-7-deazaguanine synthase QueC [Methanosarcina sp.]MDD4248075.1 7-cyano-7-deazaguanine synthase QueC [Methanosarcina sp.]
MKAITLLSSGLDSVAALAIAAESLEIEMALTFDYGQRACEREIEYSQKVCEHYGIEHRVIKLDWLAEITHTSLVNRDEEVPALSFEDIDEAAPAAITEASAKAVWVPNRNGAMLNIAGSFAESRGCDYLVVGFNGEEAGTFPDNSLDYIQAMDHAFSYSTQNGVQVLAPLIELGKTEILRRALEVKAPLKYSWSCYHGGETPCGECESCVRRARAFKNAGAKDPLLKKTGV